MVEISTNKLVSVVIPAYNHEKYIKECIESIINQSYDNIELIILNDGSKDNTIGEIKILENKCKDRFNRFVIIDKENEGVCRTLNKGIKECKGIYICLVASDDIFLPNKIATQVKYLEENINQLMVSSNGYLFTDDRIEDKRIINDRPPSWSQGTDCKKKFEQILVYGNKLVNPTCMYRKETFTRIGLFDESLKFEDWDFYLRILTRYDIGYIHEPLVLYRRHGGNQSKDLKYLYEGNIQILEKFKNENMTSKMTLINKAFSNMNIFFAWRFFIVDDNNYKVCIRKAMKYSSFNFRIYVVLLKVIFISTFGWDKYNIAKKKFNKKETTYK